MTRQSRDPEPPPDPRLDAYRRAVARVFSEGRPAGFLVVRVTTVWTAQGRFWNRRWVDPHEVINWMITYAPHEPHDSQDPIANPHTFDDGYTLRHDLDTELEDFGANRFRLRGEILSLEWLSGDEAEAAYSAYGWRD